MDVVLEKKYIVSVILTIRNEKVILDRDLANLYQVSTKAFNQAIKRNIKRFEGFYFQLTDAETKELVTNCDRFKSLKHSSSNPYAFTEHGVLLASGILNSNIAIQINRKVIDAFLFLKKQISSNSSLNEIQDQLKKIMTILPKIDLLESNQKLMQAESKIDAKINQNNYIDLKKKYHQLLSVVDELQSAHILVKKSDMLSDDYKEMN